MDPYRPDEFGDTIVVEHRLERQGGGSYKMRDGVDGPARVCKKCAAAVDPCTPAPSAPAFATRTRRMDGWPKGTGRTTVGLAARESSPSLRRRDLDELCSHMNIQAANPCALLTQEHAKKFLHNGNEEDRYRFFLEAANMATRKTDLLAARANIEVCEPASRARTLVGMP